MNIEEWRAALRFEGAYEVSNLGRVRSLDRSFTYQKVDQYSGRIITVTKRVRGQLLRPGTMKSGHQFVVLGRGNGFCVHTLVLSAFVGACPDGLECCHNDGNPANNHVNNLRWDTRKSNVHDMIRHGTMKFGGRVNA